MWITSKHLRFRRLSGPKIRPKPKLRMPQWHQHAFEESRYSGTSCTMSRTGGVKSSHSMFPGFSPHAPIFRERTQTCLIHGNDFGKCFPSLQCQSYSIVSHEIMSPQEIAVSSATRNGRHLSTRFFRCFLDEAWVGEKSRLAWSLWPGIWWFIYFTIHPSTSHPK